MRRYYDIKFYDSLEDYNIYSYSALEQGYTNKREALKVAKSELGNYPIIKVQSQDYEFIEVLTVDGIKV